MHLKVYYKTRGSLIKLLNVMKKILAIILVAVSSVSLAGGDHFPVRIVSISNDGVDFSLIAKPMTEERKWMDSECLRITVKGSYDRVKWLLYKRPMSKERHLVAIEALKEAYLNNRRINLGYIGGGLYRVGECSYKSKALIYENSSVYSLYATI
jgi:hypothetical protein